MTFELSQVAFLSIAYLLLLFGIAYSTERGWIPDAVVQHPITYILSLGIFASAWSFYGVIDLAFQHGYGALAYYLGTGALFLFAPVVLAPLAELARRYQILTLADLLVFRYHSQAIGGLATLCMLLAVLPLLALQIQAVADTLRLLTEGETPAPLQDTFTFREAMALLYCVILALFTILFGSNQEHHRGLITAMAFESLVKVCALCIIGLLAVYGVFGGLDQLDVWLSQNPENLELLYDPIRSTSSHTLLLVFIATAVAMPHIFHMAVVENTAKHATVTITWAFPLFLLLMALPIFPILWAGFELNAPMATEYFPLGVPMLFGSPTLSIIAFIGGLSAATGALVAITLSLTTMLLNHWLLPIFHFGGKYNIYQQLLWLRRSLIAAIFIGGYLFYLSLNNEYSLTNLALMAFIETLQFLPGILAVIYWPRGNRLGVIVGLSAGSLIWGVGLLLPLITGMNALYIPGVATPIPLGFEYWNGITLLSLSVNVALFVLLSLATEASDEERYSAEICAGDELSHPMRLALDVYSPAEFQQRLSQSLGHANAREEVDRALRQLNLSVNERRPYALRRLRDQLEINLSRLMGIGVASEILDDYIPYKVPQTRATSDINLIESRLAQYRNHLTGMAAELNNLRLYHRNTLQELPLAVCSLGKDLEILMWNRAMEELTGIPTDEVMGSHLDNIAQPWGTLIGSFSRSRSTHRYKQQVQLNAHIHWISLHKSSIQGPAAQSTEDQVILLEDVTETQLLEQELVHSERLASVGRLAAGVAHEIGNPITGIDCLAQNLRYESDCAEVRETADQILSQTSRISRIVQSLVSFSHIGKQSPEDFQPVNLQACVDEAMHLLRLQRDKTQVQFRNTLSGAITVRGDSQRLIQVFVNLLSNARDASPEGGEVVVSASQQDEIIVISVTDEGSGIAPEHMERILEPFFTTKEPGEGTGLGLSMVYSIIEDHGGHIDIESPANPEKRSGARFNIKLPRQPLTQMT
ncbi:PAS domain-containing protein [Exilibacterium tricleocarpae]|uniref:histidine kinase n=1 Tax=Exilibacterium tricleocarpae TaxID=2591008 RepID=A0A545STJ7_9GAMM|nr:ATP-binding protein [Exilibacterium tricleocarpae]TQV68294.1 PAS domain-containing protein [Exilibacterium tricleocarpae]